MNLQEQLVSWDNLRNLWTNLDFGLVKPEHLCYNTLTPAREILPPVFFIPRSLLPRSHHTRSDTHAIPTHPSAHPPPGFPSHLFLCSY